MKKISETRFNKVFLQVKPLEKSFNEDVFKLKTF